MPTPKTTGLQSQFPSRLFLFFFPRLLIGFTCTSFILFLCSYNNRSSQKLAIKHQKKKFNAGFCTFNKNLFYLSGMVILF